MLFYTIHYKKFWQDCVNGLTVLQDTLELVTVESRLVWCTIHPSWITFLPAFFVCFIDWTTLIRGMLPLATLFDMQQQVITVLLATGCIAAAPREYGWENRPRQDWAHPSIIPFTDVPLPVGDPGPSPIHGSFGPMSPPPDGISISSSVLQGSRSWQTGRQTNTQTDRHVQLHSNRRALHCMQLNNCIDSLHLVMQRLTGDSEKLTVYTHVFLSPSNVTFLPKGNFCNWEGNRRPSMKKRQVPRLRSCVVSGGLALAKCETVFPSRTIASSKQITWRNQRSERNW